MTVLGFSCSMWDLVPRPGIEPGLPELGALSLSHWTTGEVPKNPFLKVASKLRVSLIDYRGKKFNIQ